MNFTWDPAAGRYRDARGRYVSRAAVRRALDTALASADNRARALALQLKRRKIATADWRLAMRRIIKETHLYSAAAAVGGWGQLTAQDFGRLGVNIRLEYGYLERFVRQIEAGYLLDGRFLARAEMYVEAARHTFSEFDSETMQALGADVERNVMGPAEHCDECPGLSALGWVPVGTLPLIGDRKCMVRCKCRIEFGTQGVDGAVTPL